MTAASKISLNGLAKRLVNDKLLSKEDALQATSDAIREELPFVSYLVQNEMVKASAIAFAAADEFGAPVINLEALDTEQFPRNIMNEKLIRTHHALPLFKRGTRLLRPARVIVAGAGSGGGKADDASEA